MGTFWTAPTTNYKQTTLNGSITSGANSIVVNSTANMQSPGYIVIDRQDASGNNTPNAREVVSYTSITGNTLNGCTRGQDNSSQLAHNDGAIVETMPTVGMWNSLVTIVASAMDSNGSLNAFISPVTIGIGHFVQFDVTSIASIAQANIAINNIGTRLDVSAASVTGLGLSPVFIGSGQYSGPTIALGGLLIAPRPATLQWVSVLTKYVASTASVGFDFKVRGSSIFANATTLPAIAAGGTFVSTASIATKNINVGDILQGDIASVGANGMIQEVTIQAGSL
jgi:hypothetical protein